MRDTYWITRFLILRWLGLVYLAAFFTATRQLVPLVGANGLTPGPLFLSELRNYYQGTWNGFLHYPTLFWFDGSDTALRLAAWIGVALSCLMVAGYANALMLTVMWALYFSIVHIGQDWFGYGWEIQLLETGFLGIFLCPLLDARPFTPRPPPIAIIFLFRWLIVRIMLGSALIKLRGDASWHDLTALCYFFETQPIPNPTSRWFHFLPHPLLQAGTVLTFVVELVAPFFAFGPRWARYAAGSLFIGFQGVLILSGNLSFFNWLTIVPALACFDDRFWSRLTPAILARKIAHEDAAAKPSRPMIVTSWIYAGIVGLLSIQPVLNLCSSQQAMNTSFDPLHLVNTYGAFGYVGKQRDVLVFEGTMSMDPATATDWKEYSFAALPGDIRRAPVQIAPYQPHLDWQLWFAAMAGPDDYPWTLNLVWKLLHNDSATLGLMSANPFPGQPPRSIRVLHYIYHFAPAGNSDHVYWTRDQPQVWLPPFSADSPELLDFLHRKGWLPDTKM